MSAESSRGSMRFRTLKREPLTLRGWLQLPVENSPTVSLTSEKPEQVEQAYLEAVIWAPAYAEEAMQRGLELFGELGIDRFGKVDIKGNRDIALKAIKSERQDHNKPGRILLFAGLRMETEKWKRRPNGMQDKQAEDDSHRRIGAEEHERRNGRKKAEISYLPDGREHDAKERIKNKIKAEKDKGEILFGMAGGGCGSDLLFHELCWEMDISTKLYLALPKDQYIGEYVAPAGADWVDRFNQIYRLLETADKVGQAALDQAAAAAAAKAQHEPREPDSDVEKFINLLSSTKELPRWLQGKASYNLERRCHVWMLQHALMQRHVYGRAGHEVEITLIVLWDGGIKEGMGGLGHLIELAERQGIKVLKIDCREWLDPKYTAKPRHEPKGSGDVPRPAEASAS